MPAQLMALDDGPSILLDKPILLLGRHPECDIQIDSRKISRRHCVIAQVNDYLVVRDLASTNGVRINGVRVVEGRLRAGDEVTIGNHRYRVAWEEVGNSLMSAPPVPQRPREGRVQPPLAPLPADEMEDELLEAADEPIPLKEPDSPLPVDIRTARADAQGLPEKPGPILPDNLELLPGGSAYPGAKSNPPANQPPPAPAG
jgi:predicted component of type VI protein secretion system